MISNTFWLLQLKLPLLVRFDHLNWTILWILDTLVYLWFIWCLFGARKVDCSKVTSHPQKGGSANQMGTGGTGSYSRTRQEVGLSHMKYDPIRFQTHLLKKGAELAP